jgi:hypothetical protein
VQLQVRWNREHKIPISPQSPYTPQPHPTAQNPDLPCRVCKDTCTIWRQSVFFFSLLHQRPTRFFVPYLTLTLLQREPPLTIIRDTLRSQGVRGLYAGCTALVVGNSAKAGVRFLSYDKFKQALADKDVSSLFPTGTPQMISSIALTRFVAPRTKSARHGAFWQDWGQG